MEIKEALLQIKEDAKIGDIKKHIFGICSILSNISGSNGYLFVNSNCSDWEYFSGDLHYPVSGKDIWIKHAYKNSLWEGEQLDLRLSLIDHLLTKC